MSNENITKDFWLLMTESNLSLHLSIKYSSTIFTIKYIAKGKILIHLS